jgi:hypothetical protein
MTASKTHAHNGPGDSGTPCSLPFDPSVAHQARMYDYLLGGKDNYEADRKAMAAILEVHPDAAFTARANRAFLGRAVRYLAGEAGIRQFLDIGTGIPTAGNTHEAAQAIAPESRVVYVDYDPVVLAHARALLISAAAGATEYIDADLRDTATILGRASELLDFTRPVAVTLISVLHAIPDSDNPHAIVASLLDALPSGSYLAISHAGSDLYDQDALDSIKGIATEKVRQQLAARTREQVAQFFDGLDLVEPGIIVRVEEWHPGRAASDPGTSSLWCAVGRKR